MSAELRLTVARDSVYGLAASPTARDLARSDTDKNAGRTADGTPAVLAETEHISAALGPELQRVIDTTMERVAEIERQTLNEARDLMVSSEHDSRDALERSSRLVKSLEALTGTVSHVTSTLRTEVDEVTEALRGLRESRVQLPEELLEELVPRRSHDDGEPAQPAPVEAEPPQAAALPDPQPRPEPSPELTDHIYLSEPPKSNVPGWRGLFRRRRSRA